MKTRIGIDGKWAGATHGDSHFFMGVGPGVHHLCAYTEFGAIGGAQLAFAHFSAQAGAVYYFEVINKGIGDDLGDVALFPADEDQGRYLVGSTPLIASQPKK